jgi:hypothetical protein
MKSVFDFSEIREELGLGDIEDRARRAAALLEDLVFVRAALEAEQNALGRWVTTNLTEEGAREREDCWSTLRGIESVRAVLRSYVTDAEVACEHVRLRELSERS